MAGVLIKSGLVLCGIHLTNNLVLERLDYYLSLSDYLPLAAFVATWLTALAALFYVAFVPAWGVRLAWSAVIGLSTLVGQVFFLIAGDRLTMGALDSMWDTSLVGIQFPVFYGGYVLRAALETSILLAGLLLPAAQIEFLCRPYLAFLPLFPCLLLGAVIVYAADMQGDETKGMPSQFHDISLFVVYSLSPSSSLDKAEIELRPAKPALAHHVILVVDESVSGDFIDPNVVRGTTPFLQSIGDTVVNFGLATAASNCSNWSNAVLRLGANPSTMGRGDDNILGHPSIWKYAALAGYETTFIDAQGMLDNHYDHFGKEELALIDEYLTVPEGTPWPYQDREVLQLLLPLLNRPTPQFVLVNKRGAHVPYPDNYPQDAAVFSPAMTANEPLADRQRMVNAYKNAIGWAVDEFFRILLADADLSRSVLIYTSDHGQNLLDDGKPATHCRRLGHTLNEVVVPLLVWVGDPELHLAFSNAALENRNAASHFEIFPTLLVLFGYDPYEVGKRYHTGLLDRIKEPLGFTTGSIAGRFGRPPVWTSRAGLDQLQR